MPFSDHQNLVISSSAQSHKSMKAVYIVDDPLVANVLIDPMRRAILDLLRKMPMTQAKLAEELGLSGPSLNYHIKLLRSKKLVTIVKRESEKHGIMQKFFGPAAYLFIYDLDLLPKNISRYFYPVGLERARGIASALILSNKRKYKIESSNEAADQLTERISRSLVSVAKSYANLAQAKASEEFVYKIYAEAIEIALK
jgi:DNA-binding transcriptional ArsR family regulator